MQNKINTIKSGSPERILISLDDKSKEKKLNHSSAYHINNVCSLSFKKKKMRWNTAAAMLSGEYFKLSETSIELEYASDVH